MARKRGLPWTHNIVAKKNAPNLMYAQPGAYATFEGEYQRLARFFVT